MEQETISLFWLKRCFMFLVKFLRKWHSSWPSFSRHPRQTLHKSHQNSTISLLTEIFSLFDLSVFLLILAKSAESRECAFQICLFLTQSNPHMSVSLFRLHLDSSAFGSEHFLLQPEFGGAVSIWKSCPFHFFFTPQFVYDAQFGSALLYNLSEANWCHTSPHVLFMDLKTYIVNDTKYSVSKNNGLANCPTLAAIAVLPSFIRLFCCSFLVAGS